MKVPMFAHLAILIAHATVTCCFASVDNREDSFSKVTEAWMPNGAGTHSAEYTTDANFGELFVGSDAAYNHYRVVSLQSASQTDGQELDQSSTSQHKTPAVVLDKAILLWDQADVLSKSIIRLKQDLTQIPENPKLQLNKKAIESSLLDAQDQLDEKVYEVLQKAQKLYGKSASILSDNAAGMVERAEDVLEETSQSFNHLVKVVQQRIKKFKDNTMKLKESAYNIWKMVPKVQDNLSSLSIKAKSLFAQKLMSKQELLRYLQYLTQQEAVLLQDVVEELKQFQPFNKATANFLGGDDTLDHCQQVLSNIIHQLKKVDEKMDEYWARHTKGKKDHGSSGSDSKATQTPFSQNNPAVDSKSKRSVKIGAKKNITQGDGLLPVIFVIGLLAGCGLIFVSLRRRIRENKLVLPFTISDC